VSFSENVIVSIGILVGLIFLAMGLRKIGVLKEEDGGVLAGLITNVSLPALIFTALSRSHFEVRHLLVAVAMMSAEIACALLAWGVAFLFRLSRPKKGALILASTFGSSAFLGYAVVKSVYQGNTKALADAAVVSELGVGFLLFTLGVFIAIHYGGNMAEPGYRRRQITKFFYSPIFLALTMGIVVSLIPFPRGFWLVTSGYRLLGIMAGANTLLVTMTIGVMLHFRDLRRVFFVVMLACLIKLIAQPLLADWVLGFFSFADIWRHILIMEASMPTAALTAVFAKRYGCDAELTSILVFATFISSIFTMVVIIVLLA